MQPGESKAQIGDPLPHVIRRLSDNAPYRVLYCSCCQTLFKQLVTDNVAREQEQTRDSLW